MSYLVLTKLLLTMVYRPSSGRAKGDLCDQLLRVQDSRRMTLWWLLFSVKSRLSKYPPMKQSLNFVDIGESTVTHSWSILISAARVKIALNKLIIDGDHERSLWRLWSRSQRQNVSIPCPSRSCAMTRW